MRRVPIALVLIALVILIGLAAVTGSTAKPTVLPRPGIAAVTSTELVCPSIDGKPGPTSARAVIANVSGALSPASQNAGTVTATTLAGSKSSTKPLHVAPVATIASVAKQASTYAIAATGSVAATIAADQITETTGGRFRGLAGTRCETPSTDWWFSGADGRVGFTDVLTISNPSSALASVAVSMWGQTGPVNNQLQSVNIRPRSTARIAIATAAPDIANVGVHVHATSGSVVASLIDRRSSGLRASGGDFIPPAGALATMNVIPGFPGGKGGRYLILTNPGALDATVNVRLVTKSGSFAPSGANQVVVRAGRTKVVSLAPTFAGSPGAVELTSDQPITANGLAVAVEKGGRPDQLWLGVTPPIKGSAAIADGKDPDGGHTTLYLSAPLAAAQVKVTGVSGHSTTVSVPAGSTVSTDITSVIKAATGPETFVVTPLGAAPVYGERVLSFAGAHGALMTGESLIGLPQPIILPPVREDPTIATR